MKEFLPYRVCARIVRKKHFWFFLGIVILSWVIFANRFPAGFIIAGEDTPQMIHLAQNFTQLMYEWEGRSALFYGVFYFLDRIGISETAQLSWYLGIFLFGSYFSFWLFVRLIFGNVQKNIIFLCSLFYALNLYTLTLFTYSWGYSYYQSLYIFIPLLIGLFMQFLRTGIVRYGAWFVFVLFFASVGFGNPAFALSLIIFLSFFTLFLFVAKQFARDRTMPMKILLVGIFSLLVSAYWILPVVAQMKVGIESLNTVNIIDLSWWLQHTSNPIINTLRLAQFNESSFFPENFPYVDLKSITFVFLLLTFLPTFLIFFSLWQKKSIGTRKLYWVFFALLIVFILLVARVRFPFEGINDFLFHLPGMNTLRGYEKLAIFTPFIIASLLLITLIDARSKRYYTIAVWIFILILLTPLPFYAGKLQQNMSFIFAHGAKDYREAQYSFLVKIPDAYYDVRGLLNNDPEQVKIATLPYNVIGSIGWSNYPAWKLQGADPTQRLYTKKIIDANAFYVNQWLYAKDFNESSHDPVWIVKLLGMMNVKYIIYHKDVDQKFLAQSIEKMRYLEERGVIKALARNDYFDLYAIDKQYILPHVGWYEGDLALLENPSAVTASYEKARPAIAARFNTVHPKKITIASREEENTPYLVLNEQKSGGWQASYVKNNKRIILKRADGFAYANAWRVPTSVKENITIEYVPMKLFFIGSWISGAALVIVSMYLIYGGTKRRHN